MPTQQNSDNLAATARTISSGSGGTTVQADLAVNDTTSARYVRNRTHWKEEYDGPEGDVIAETSVAFTTNIKTITGTMSDGLVEGGKYIVTWNGTDYECVCKDGSDGRYIGNGSLMNVGSITYEDTGEPFCVLLFGGTYYMVYKNSTTAETVTVKVVGVKETIWHKLDGGYLPEGVPYSEGMRLMELLPETTAAIDPDAGAAFFSDVLDIVNGNAYTVKYNGAEYVCTAQPFSPEEGLTASALGNLGAMTGGESTGEPFLLLCFNAETAAMMGAGCGCFALDGSESVTLSISGEAEKNHRMHGKLLPTGTPYIEPLDDVVLEETVLADTAVDMTTWNGYFNLPIGNVVAGEIYEVALDGVSYQTKAYPAINSTIPGNCVILGSGTVQYSGNGASMDFAGAPYSNVPFGMLVIDPAVAAELDFNVLGAWTNGVPERMSIRRVAAPHKISNDCLPDIVLPLVVTFDNGDTSSVIEEALCAGAMGRPVFIVLNFDSGVINHSIATSVSFGNLNIYFYALDENGDQKRWAWSADGLTATTV